MPILVNLPGCEEKVSAGRGHRDGRIGNSRRRFGIRKSRFSVGGGDSEIATQFRRREDVAQQDAKRRLAGWAETEVVPFAAVRLGVVAMGALAITGAGGGPAAAHDASASA